MDERNGDCEWNVKEVEHGSEWDVEDVLKWINY